MARFLVAVACAKVAVAKNATVVFPRVEANSQWECEDSHAHKCGAVDGVLVTCDIGRCCSQYGWCDKGNCGGGEQSEFSYNAHQACEHIEEEESVTEEESLTVAVENTDDGQNATLVFPRVEANSQWECEDSHAHKCGAVDGVLVTCDIGRCCSQYGWCDKGNCGGGEQSEFSYNAHQACEHVDEETAPVEEKLQNVAVEPVDASKNATLVFPQVDPNSQWECEDSHAHKCGAVDGVLVTCDIGRCCSQYGWCDKGNCGGGEQSEFSYNAHQACEHFDGAEAFAEEKDPIVAVEHVDIGANETLVFPQVEADSQWDCEDSHAHKCGAVDGVLVTCDTGRCCSQYGWCDKGNCGGGEQTEFSYNAHNACHHSDAEETVPEEKDQAVAVEHLDAGRNETLVFPHIEADSQWDCEDSHAHKCGAVDGVLVTCDTGRCCSQYGWCDKGNCGGGEQSEFSYNAHNACHHSDAAGFVV